MSHLVNALDKFHEHHPDVYEAAYISVVPDRGSGQSHLTAHFQAAPIGEVGVTGIQAVDLLEFTKYLFESLNAAYPCRENSLTITKIEEAIHWQEARTKDRVRRQVEGKNAI